MRNKNRDNCSPDNSNLQNSHGNRRLYIETYGCQMNVSDSEIVVSIMQDNNMAYTPDINEADIILINTCSIRKNAEQRVWGRLGFFRQLKKTKPDLLIGVIGCMAERLKEKLIEKDKLIDLVIGPDAYRHLPSLLVEAGTGQKAINVLLSREETYADISPVRYDKNRVSAFVSIMRGCNNYCAFCIVPYTRGRERSRDPLTILGEIRELAYKGYKEVTLLGQNVNSYRWINNKDGIKLDFAALLEEAARQNPRIRMRFSTSHPRDISDKLPQNIAFNPSICKHIHFPVQSGSNRILKLMNRGYSREDYLDRIYAVKKYIKDCSVSTDIIAGFPGETEDDHHQTLSLMKEVGYDFAFMFKYSERPGTDAAKNLKDDIPEEIKTRRLNEIITLQGSLSEKSKKGDLGTTVKVLVEGISKKSDHEFYGRTSQNKVVVFPSDGIKFGDYVKVHITGYTPATLIGLPL